jgi:hypothetical protein
MNFEIQIYNSVDGISPLKDLSPFQCNNHDTVLFFPFTISNYIFLSPGEISLGDILDRFNNLLVT